MTRKTRIALAVLALGAAFTATSASAQGFNSSGNVTMERQANTYVKGEGYDTLYGYSLAACEAQCRSDTGCAMVEFYKPDNKCNLFRHTKTAGASREAMVSIKRTQPQSWSWPWKQPQEANLRRLSDSYVIGEGYDTFTRSNVAECETVCKDDASCKMFEFFKPERKCNLYSHRSTRYASGNTAIVGVKE